MRLSSFSVSLALLAPLALASPNLAAESNDAILKRAPVPMQPLFGRQLGQSPAHVLARSPQNNDDCDSDERRCGNACVDEDWNCCPDNVNGGCPRDKDCIRVDGVWGCCPEGEDCRWDDDDDDDDDDDRNIFDRIGDGIDDLGNDIEDTWNDVVNDDDDDAAGILKPGLGVALMAAVVAAVLPL
ncbi:hypothetical protein BDW74DRAFT_156861 [Aspergillus multicolor]|uniref:uncharacterized protein n=1 Tax=Aspergillus multicolor TaxID=41759 RepID=UPI003CCD564B